MRHHLYNKDFKFVHNPIDFDKTTKKEMLQYCLGATLYMPGTKDIADRILQQKLIDVTSIVLDFEDAVPADEIGMAENNVIKEFKTLFSFIEKGLIEIENIPLIFLRVKNVKQFRNFVKKLDNNASKLLSGFVFPKFHSYNANEYLDILSELNLRLKVNLYAMPIFEGKRIAYIETRNNELNSLREILEPYKELILNLRVGGTDFSSLFSVRRGINYSIYDILPVRDCLSDILNFFGRKTDDYIVSGPVWEYFLAYNENDLNQLIDDNIHSTLNRGQPILNDAIDGLLREVIIDKANGFVGKTIIHPSHARFVNTLQAVTKEEYDDALQIIETKGGVIKSKKSNKMNEINPHKNWAEKIIKKSKAYGVIEDEASYIKMLTK